MQAFTAKKTMLTKSNVLKNLLYTGLALSLVLSACGQRSSKSGPQQQAAENTQQSEKVPGQLKDLENNIEKMIKTLDGPAKSLEEENKEKTQSSQNATKQGNTQGQSKQDTANQGTQQGTQGSKSSQDQQAQQTQQEDPWSKITGIIDSMHFQWNAYMPSAVKKGAPKTLIDNFSNALNALTVSTAGKNRINTLLAANKLYSYIPDFANLYRTEVSPEIKRIRYYTRNVMLSASTGNWSQVDSDVNNMKSTWSMYKNAVSKEQQDMANKLDFSLYELEKVSGDKNQQLIQIKGKVAMSNIDELEKSMEKSQGEKTQ